jgi:hypothetical protein
MEGQVHKPENLVHLSGMKLSMGRPPLTAPRSSS